MSDGVPRGHRWGFSLTAEELGGRALVELGMLAEEEGYTDLWGFEAGGYDGVAPAAAVLQATHTVRVGNAVLNAYSRTPFTLAMTAAFLGSLSEGRFCLGLGSSSRKIVSEWHGLAFERPVTRVREVTEVVRALLGGERTRYEGATLELHDARLAVPPGDPVPIWLAALGPRMLDLAGELADGLVLTLSGPGPAGEMSAQAREAADACGRAEPLEVVHRPVMPYPGEDDAALEICRQLIADYCLIPVYRRMFTRFGFGTHVERVEQARERGGRRGARGAVSEELVGEFAIVGTREEQYQRLLAYERNGVDVPLVSVYPGPADPVERRAIVEEALRWFGRRRAEDVTLSGTVPESSGQTRA